MFEFGKDLRKLFAQAREADDLGWLELIGVGLVESEARQQSTDAGRVSCAEPFEASLRAAALWREHARRAGYAKSLERSWSAALDATGRARTPDQSARAAIETARLLMLRFDLCGGPDSLTQALATLDMASGAQRADTASSAAAVHARLVGRQARLTGDAKALMDAGALMDAALHGLRGGARTDQAEELRLDRAALSLEAGVLRRDPRLLDQAGRDLSALVEAASPDYRPLTRARALALCGAGLSALGAMAGHAESAAQGRLMFEAAADQFTPDHSPLDWAAIQILRADDPRTPLLALAQAEALTEGSGLILGAQAREARLSREIALAEADGALPALDAIEARLRRRLSRLDADAAPLDWTADQIGLARLSLARTRLTGLAAPALGMIIAEAALTAREHGAPALAHRAERLLHQP
jgi:hypothetical protein